MKKYNIVQSYWFSSFHCCIGIVEIENSVGEHKFYIGPGGGHNQETDEEFIVAFGAPFNPKVFEVKND
jgi:hypothetical protein